MPLVGFSGPSGTTEVYYDSDTGIATVPRRCSSCKTAIIEASRKRCAPCRANDAAYILAKTKARTEKTVQERVAFKAEIKHLEKAKKRKAVDQGDESGKKKAKRFKQILNAVTQNSSGAVDAPRPKSKIPEFQTINELATRLKTLTSAHQYCFQACYSIVASPDIDNAKRARLVGKEIRGFLRFDRHDNIYGGINTKDAVTLQFRCTCAKCTAAAQPAASAAPGKDGAPGLKRRQSDLRKWMSEVSKGSSSASTSTSTSSSSSTKTGGTITVKSETDRSHSQFRGQKITVSVEHGMSL